MKKLIVLLFLCVNVCGYVFASQAIPGPYLEIQPNGDSIYVYFRGDEYGSFNTDLKGYVVDKNEEGYWVYVTLKRGKLFLTNQIVTKTSTPKNVDSKGVRSYLAEKKRRCYDRRHRRLPEFTIKNERVKKWINSEIESCDIKDPINNLSWLVSKTDFGEYDFSCLLLYKNDSTNEYYIVNHFIDFSVRSPEHDITNVTNVVDVYKFDGKWFVGGAILDKSSDFYESLNVTSDNERLGVCIDEIDKLFNKKYEETGKLIKLAQKRKKNYSIGHYVSCKYCDKLVNTTCEDFFKTHTLVDVIGYSYIKYPMGVKYKVK